MNVRTWAVSRPRLNINLWLAILGALAISYHLILNVSSVFAADPTKMGYHDFSYGTPNGSCSSKPTAEKPESKLWFNDGLWWGSLCNDAEKEHHIYRLDTSTQRWIDTGTVLDDRAKSRADVLWDGQHLYVASHSITANGQPSSNPNQWGRLYRYSYAPATQTYRLDSGFPVYVTRGRSETLTIAQDSTGQLWVTYVESQQVMINHSLDSDDRVWGDPVVLPAPDAANLTNDDISAVIAFNGRIGVMWSNQNTGKMHFAAHVDGTPAAAWQSTDAYPISADDHINLKSLRGDPAGSLFAVIKTSFTHSTEPLIVLLICTGGDCTSSDDWEAHTVSRVADHQTRPILLLDTEHRNLYVLSTQLNSGRTLFYKRTSMDHIVFGEGPGLPFIQTGIDPAINNATSTKQNVDHTTGLLVLASDKDTRSYVHNVLCLETNCALPPDATPTPPPAPAGQVAATVETDPVPHPGDAADDTAIWAHPSDPALSTIIGTDKQGGLAVYDLAGHQLQYRPDGQINNVDLRYNFPLGHQSVTLVTASNRTDNTIAIYQINPDTRELEDVAARPIPVGISEPYGLCMYHSPTSGRYYVVVNDKDGDVEQWKLFDDGSSHVDGTVVRTFSVGSQTEGCVADDELDNLYIGEEDVGIWKYGAEPNAGTARTLVDTTGAGGHLQADVEGLTIYYASDNTGYLMASNQGQSHYTIYRREGDNDYLATFEIVRGNSIDGVSATDGIDVTNFPLGPAFSEGVFVTQDGDNGAANQNYKLVPWPRIARAVQPALTIDTTWDPRQVGAVVTPTPTPLVEPCGTCKGGVTELTLQYHGPDAAEITIRQKNGDIVFGPQTVGPDTAFSFSGTGRRGQLGGEISIYVNRSQVAKIRTDCSQIIGPGLSVGDFEVIAGRSQEGGALCPLFSDCHVSTDDQLDIRKKKVKWNITNNEQDPLVIKRIALTWPVGNGSLKKVTLNKDIFTQELPAPSATIDSDWQGNLTNRTVEPGRHRKLTFEFKHKAGTNQDDYSLRVEFMGPGCVAEFSSGR